MQRKHAIIVLILVLLILVLSGCSPSPTNFKPIDPNGSFWDRYFVFPLSWALDRASVFLFNSYGLGILAVTIIIRLILLPLNIKQLKSSKAMQKLQPEMMKIREKFKDNQQKMQEETMKLFQKHGVNPLSGCLPILIQMPILIAFYHAIMRDETLRTQHFLWLNLGDPDHLYILPILAAVTTYLQTKVMGTTATINAQQKTMFLIMPFFIFFIAISLPSALSLYWVYGNLFMIVQTYIINQFDKKKELAKV